MKHIDTEQNKYYYVQHVTREKVIMLHRRRQPDNGSPTAGLQTTFKRRYIVKPLNLTVNKAIKVQLCQKLK